MRHLTLLLPLALVACATPAEVRRDGARHEYSLSLPPQKAASCMARNADEHTGLASSIRDSKAGALEVIVRNPDGVIVVAEVEPRGAGSKAVLWRQAMPIFPRDLHNTMAKGC